MLGSVMSGGQTKKVLALIRPGSTVIDDLIRGFDEGGSSFYALSALNSLLAQSFKQEDEAKRYWQANKKSFFEARSMSK